MQTNSSGETTVPITRMTNPAPERITYTGCAACTLYRPPCPRRYTSDGDHTMESLASPSNDTRGITSHKQENLLLPFSLIWSVRTEVNHAERQGDWIVPDSKSPDLNTLLEPVDQRDERLGRRGVRMLLTRQLHQLHRLAPILPLLELRTRNTTHTQRFCRNTPLAPTRAPAGRSHVP